MQNHVSCSSPTFSTPKLSPQKTKRAFTLTLMDHTSSLRILHSSLHIDEISFNHVSYSSPSFSTPRPSPQKTKRAFTLTLMDHTSSLRILHSSLHIDEISFV
ncbi:hypothetical protein VNO77_02277 [Canavalia gladiata]|uniref:Uncharacterized protein n=1 Tax=Canavalia gladiata TaxID=3824 RepID=A0AAN9MXV9_CANGL